MLLHKPVISSSPRVIFSSPEYKVGREERGGDEENNTYIAQNEERELEEAENIKREGWE
jgi:hypothetical protein